MQVLTGILLACLGLLLGEARTNQALQPKHCRQAEERRRLNEKWRTVRTAQRRWRECPRCGKYTVSTGLVHRATAVENRLDGD
jgi:hypothetical protein